MTELAVAFIRERFERVNEYRYARRWDAARVKLAEIALHIDELPPSDRQDVRTWHVVQTHIVEASRWADTDQSEPELRHVTRARYAVEHLPKRDLDEEHPWRLRIEFLHAELCWRELHLGLRCRFGDRRPDLVIRCDALLEEVLRCGQKLACRQLDEDPRLAKMPRWMRIVTARGNMMLFGLLLDDDPQMLEEPATLISLAVNLTRMAGDPSVWLSPLFDDPDFVRSYQDSHREALRRLLEKPAAREMKAWLEVLWANGLTAVKYQEIASGIRNATCFGMLECIPLLARIESATRPEQRNRALAAAFEKLAERVYKPQLVALFQLTAGRDDRTPSHVGELVGTLRNMWRKRGYGPSSLLTDDAAVIRNSEAHGHTRHEDGMAVTFSGKANGEAAVLGPIRSEELERRWEAFLDLVLVIHLSACYLHHPDGYVDAAA